jgi:hypothetical protein
MRAAAPPTEQQVTNRPLIARKRPCKQMAEVLGHDCRKSPCRIGGKLTVDDLAETSEVGDWKMPDFKAACTYAADR